MQQLVRIKRLKDLLGFSLAEIRELAHAEEQREHVGAAWRKRWIYIRARRGWTDPRNDPPPATPRRRKTDGPARDAVESDGAAWLNALRADPREQIQEGSGRETFP